MISIKREFAGFRVRLPLSARPKSETKVFLFGYELYFEKSQGNSNLRNYYKEYTGGIDRR